MRYFCANIKLLLSVAVPGTWAGFESWEVLSQQNSVFCSPFAVLLNG